MASNVSNAVGIHRQFTPSPQDTYQKQLIVASGNTTAGAGTKAAKLASALGVLSDTLLQEIPKQNARDKKYGDFMAEAVKDDPNNAGKVVLTTQQMLANSGHQELLDNPYTMAALDKYRGENAMRDIRNRYEEDVVGKQGYCQDNASEQKRWNDFVHTHMSEYNIADSYQDATTTAQVTGDSAPSEAAAIGTVQPTSSFQNPNKEKFFNIGFYENYSTFTQNVLNAQSNEAAKNRKVIRDASFTAKLSDTFSPEFVTSHTFEEMAEKFKTAAEEYSLSGGNLYDSLPIMSKAMDNYIANNGGANLDKLFDTQVYTGVNGETYKLKDLLPYESFHGAAIQMDAARNEEEYAKFFKELGDCSSVDAIEKKWEECKKNNPHMYSEMAKKGIITKTIADKKQEIEYQKRLQSRGLSGSVGKAIQNTLGNASYANFTEWFRQYKAHNSWANGAPITAPLKVAVQQSDGSIAYKNATADDVANMGQQMMYSIMSDLANNKTSLSEAVNDAALLITAPQMKAFKSSLNAALTNTLIQSGNIDWDKATYEGTDLQNIQMALNIYNQNPSLANACLDKDNMQEIEAIAALSEVQDGVSYSSEQAFDGLKSAMKLYGTAREMLRNKDTSNEIEYKYNTVASDPNYTGMEIDTMNTYDNGDPVMADFTYTNDDYLSSRVKNLASIYIALGYDGERAVKNAMNRVRGQVVKFSERGSNVVIPKDFCTGANQSMEWIPTTAKQTIQFIMADMNGWDTSKDDTTVKYDYLSNKLLFTNNQTHEIRTFNHDDFVNEANYVLVTYPDGFDPGYDFKGHQPTEDEFEDNPTEKYSVLNY